MKKIVQWDKNMTAAWWVAIGFTIATRYPVGDSLPWWAAGLFYFGWSIFVFAVFDLSWHYMKIFGRNIKKAFADEYGNK